MGFGRQDRTRAGMARIRNATKASQVDGLSWNRHTRTQVRRSAALQCLGYSPDPTRLASSILNNPGLPPQPCPMCMSRFARLMKTAKVGMVMPDRSLARLIVGSGSATDVSAAEWNATVLLSMLPACQRLWTTFCSCAGPRRAPALHRRRVCAQGT